MKLRIVLLFVIGFEIAALGSMAFFVRKEAIEFVEAERELLLAVYARGMERELQRYVELARSMIQQLARGNGDVAELQGQALQLLSRMGFDKDGYFFAYDKDGSLLLDSKQMYMEGLKLCDLQEPAGREPVELILAKARNGGGFVSYDWQKPSSQKQARKLSYVFSIDNWDWIIGTGIYMDELSDALVRIEERARQNISRTLNKIFLIAALSIIFIGATGFGVYLRSYRTSSEKLRQLAQRVVRAQEEERCRVARELHDGVVQVLVSSKYHLEAAQYRQAHADQFVDTHSPSTEHLIGDGLQRLNKALGEIHRVSHDLRPALLDDLGLVPALRQLVNQLRDQHALDVVLIEKGSPLDLPIDESTALFRVVQEAINNILAHAQATRVTISLNFAESRVTLGIRDDGVGFDLKKIQADARGGIGLRNMRERIESFKGRLSIRSSPRNTCIEACLDLSKRA
ncbi:cache domain-containing protein [Thauera sp. SDU_THAU2]|uniref:cache domain-containing protein n=1 Tax=Thauera sp. SDU_THAU2 TaxID=3136633 RepID=UPI00311F3AD5